MTQAARRRAAGVVFFTNIALEVLLVTTSVAGPAFQRVFSLSKTQLGLCLGASSAGMGFLSLAAGHVTFRFGATSTLAVGLVGAMFGVLVVTASQGLLPLLSGLVVVGLCAALIANANATFIADLYPRRIRSAMALASAIWFGSSTLSAPSIGAWIEYATRAGLGSWSFRGPYLADLALLGLCLALTFVVIRRIVGEGRHDERDGDGGATSRRMRREWFWVPATAYLHGLFIIVLLTWMNPMTQAKFGVNDMQGSLAVGLVSLGIGAGRLFLWKVPVPLDDRIILSGSGLVGAGLLTITFLAPSYWVTILMLVVAGFICSATFPCILSLVGNRFPATKSRMYGYMDAAVAAAGLTGPPLVGLLGDSGLLLHHAVFVSPVAGVVLAAVSMGWLGATRQADADDRSRCTP